MNAPAPGWNPDPTGRHEYRYWDGGTWTDDVSDGGATSVDPVDGPAPIDGDPTTTLDATQQYAPQPGPQPGGFGTGAPGQQPGGYDPMYGSGGQLPPARPVKAGPSTGLLVGLAAVAVALIAGIAYLVTSGGDDDDTATDETSQTSDDTSTDDTSTDDTSTDDSSTDDSSTDEGDLDLDLDDLDEDTSDDAIVDIMAAGLESGSNGQITSDQAQCAAQAMVDELGVDTIMEMSTTGENPFENGSMSTEDQVAIVTAMTECIPIDVLIEMGVDADAEG
jgi:hypothetical protein